MSKILLTTVSIFAGLFLACATADKPVSVNAVRGYTWLIAGIMKSVSK